MLYTVNMVYDDGRITNEIIHSEKPFTISPKQDRIKSSKVTVHKYNYEHYLPPVLFTSDIDGKKYIMPLGIECHPQTTENDINWTRPKLKKEIEHIQGSMGTYKTTYNPNKNTYKCTCMGFWRSKGNCKHVKALREKNLASEVK